MLFNKIAARPQAAITESSELAQVILAGGASSTGMVVTQETAMRISAVYACVRVLAESVAQLPLIYYERIGNKKERAIAQRMYTILHDAPNEFQTSFEFRETCMAHLCLRGKAYAYISRSSTGEVLELLPMMPDRVEAKQNKDWSISYKFKDASNNLIPLQQNQVFRLIGMSLDGFNGMNPIAYQRETLGIALAADKHTALTFKNGAKMTGILTNPGHFSTTDVAKRVKESWDASANGNNAFSTPLLEDGLDWKQVSMSNRDAQYIESRKYNTEDIARIFRVPPHKIGHLEKATNNNIEHQGLEFVTDSMMPWLVRWEQSIARDLLTPVQRQRYFAEFLVDGLLRGDTTARGEFYTKLWNLGAMSPNEIRAKENMNPRDGGDQYYVPLNMEPKK
jgi:HK97 family phage portal protein